MNSMTYIVLGSKSWNRRVFEKRIRILPGVWHFISKPEEFDIEKIRSLSPSALFFLHWSWKVPADIVKEFDCICFHMTDLPYGRGGSPLQNLILRGHSETKLSALKMTEGFDEGPVYLKATISLDGTAEEILTRASFLSASMIETIIKEHPTPLPQVGEPVVFRRRKADESLIPRTESIEKLHDFIRMLDGEGYPPAFLVNDGYRYELRRSVLMGGSITAEVVIKKDEAS
jgi:methionyl-tRNA formyltransferase